MKELRVRAYNHTLFLLSHVIAQLCPVQACCNLGVSNSRTDIIGLYADYKNFMTDGQNLFWGKSFKQNEARYEEKVPTNMIVMTGDPDCECPELCKS